MKKILLVFSIILLMVIVFAVAGYSFFHQPRQQSYNPKSVAQNAKQSPNNNNPQQACPDGFIKVPGSAQYHTADFCVMKYDAKCASVADLAVGLQPPLGSPASGESKGHAYGTYKNNGVGSDCTVSNNKQIVSTVSGFPIAYIPEADKTPNNAETYCAQMGWHLITNDEWMTIARNVEQVPANWCDSNGTNCGFAPGTQGKILASGHNDSNNEASAGGANHDSAIIAGNDSQPCFGTTTDGSNACGGKGSQKRILVLNNGQTIWDFAGNVWQWVDNTVMRKDEPESATNGVLDNGWTRSDFSAGSLPSVLTDNGQGATMGYDVFRPSNPSWNANNGVGRIYHYSSATDTSTTLYTFIRGGNWKHGTDDGAFTVHISPTPGTLNINDVGFRCAAPVR